LQTYCSANFVRLQEFRIHFSAWIFQRHRKREAWWEALVWETFSPFSRWDTSPCACPNSVGRA